MRKLFTLLLITLLSVNLAFAASDSTGILEGLGSSGIWYYYSGSIEVEDINGNWEIDTYADMSAIQGTNVSVVSTIYAWDANLSKTEIVTDATYDLSASDSDNSRYLRLSETRSSSFYDDWEIFSCVSYHVGSEEPGVFIGFYEQDHDWYEDWAASSPDIDYDDYTDVYVNMGESRQAVSLSPDPSTHKSIENDQIVNKLKSRHMNIFAKNKYSFIEDYYYFNMVNLSKMDQKNTPLRNNESIKALYRLQFFEILNNMVFEGDETPSYWLSDDGNTLYIGIVKKNGVHNLYTSNLKTTSNDYCYWTAPTKVK